MRLVALFASIPFMLAGCATPYAVSDLQGPPARCMKPPVALPKLKVGDDLVQEHASLRLSYGRNASNHRSCQRYIRTLLGK